MNQEALEKQQRQLRRVGRWEDVPEGAVKLTDEEVLALHAKKVMKWKPASEVWPLKHGLGILGGASGVAGILVNAHYRKKFGLSNFGRGPSYLSSIALPIIMTCVFHQLHVLNKILTGNFSCSVCLETRSGAMQAGLGGIYPMLISPMVCVVLARKYNTYPVAKIGQPQEVFKMLKRTSPVPAGLFLLVAGQFFLGMLITEREITNFQNVFVKNTWNKEELEKEGF